MIDIENSVYKFVHKAFYVRHVSCSKMVMEAESLYRHHLTPELRAYAIELYIGFEKKIINEV